MMQHLHALHALFREHHDVVDSGGGDDRPTPRPNWAMQATQLLDEIEDLIPTDIKSAPASESNDG